MNQQPTTLGAFSLSLTVRDLRASATFYAHLGFNVVMGEVDGAWVILRNGSVTLGLFHGMFERNVLTFNPGWDSGGRATDTFTDVRALHERFRAAGLNVVAGPPLASHGPASFMLIDPDGNPVLVDQHV